jgi:hypothetical protein
VDKTMEKLIVSMTQLPLVCIETTLFPSIVHGLSMANKNCQKEAFAHKIGHAVHQIEHEAKSYALGGAARLHAVDMSGNCVVIRRMFGELSYTDNFVHFCRPTYQEGYSLYLCRTAQKAVTCAG